MTGKTQTLNMAKKKQRKEPFGRPSAYKPEYCELVVHEMKQGKCIREVAAIFDVSTVTFYAWMDKHVDFLNAVQRGRDQSYKWWIEQGRNGLFDSSTVEASPDGTVSKAFCKINSRIYELFMHNMFDWSKKQTAEVQSSTTLNVQSSEDLKQQTDKITSAFRDRASFDRDDEPVKGKA